MAKSPTPQAQLREFMARYTPEIAKKGRACLTKLRGIWPESVQLVYDNYNALVVAFGPSERPSEAVLSIAFYPRWVTLFFLQGAGLPDPKELLQGQGTKVRHVVLERPSQLDERPLGELIERALADISSTTKPADVGGQGRLIIQSISPKQRPRRPSGS